MSEWTKGPWETDETRERGRAAYQIAAEGGDAAVTVVSGFRGCMNGKLRAMPQGEDYANARLIAAAPELVEALELCLGVIRHLRYLDGASVEQKRAEDVLAKVKG